MPHQRILTCPLSEEKDGEGLQLSLLCRKTAQHRGTKGRNAPGTSCHTLCITRCQSLGEQRGHSGAKGIRGCPAPGASPPL